MGLKRIPLSKITRNPNQPRPEDEFDEQGMIELAASIREQGLKQAITVRPLGWLWPNNEITLNKEGSIPCPPHYLSSSTPLDYLTAKAQSHFEPSQIDASSSACRNAKRTTVSSCSQGSRKNGTGSVQFASPHEPEIGVDRTITSGKFPTQQESASSLPRSSHTCASSDKKRRNALKPLRSSSLTAEAVGPETRIASSPSIGARKHSLNSEKLSAAVKRLSDTEAESSALSGDLTQDGDGPVQVFQLVLGERRFRAHQMIEAPDILAVVKRMDDDEMAITAIIENLQRRDISPLAEARAFQARLDAGMTEEELAKAVGLGSQPWRVTYRTRLLKLAPEHQTMLQGGHISLNAAQELSKLPQALQTKVIRRMNTGEIKGDAQVSAAVNTLLDGLTQEDIFGDSRKASDKDVATVNRMEQKISSVQQLIAAGWRDGECVAANKVDPSRARLMADKIGEIRKALYAMERDLRNVNVQAELLSAA